jgi:hypothetical protein
VGREAMELTVYECAVTLERNYYLWFDEYERSQDTYIFHVYDLLDLFAELQKATISFVMSVCLSIIMKNWARTGQIFMKFDI